MVIVWEENIEKTAGFFFLSSKKFSLQKKEEQVLWEWTCLLFLHPGTLVLSTEIKTESAI